MAELLVGQSYYLRFDPKLWAAMQPYPPLGSLVAAACLRQQGYEVAVFDAMLADSESDWESRLCRESPRIAVLFEDSFNYLSKMCLSRMREAAFRMIAAARSAEALVIVCGSDASDHGAEYLAQGANFVIRGEGEATLLDLLGQLENGVVRDPGAVQGLVYPDPVSGTPLSTPDREVMRDLDCLPFPAWDLIDVERYRRIWLKRHGYFSMNMVTTRGCPYHCNWCAKPIWGQTYNMRSPADVVTELLELKERYQPDHIWFADDIMGLKKDWMSAFADEVERRGAHVPFKCLSRVDLLLRRGEVEALKRAGCEIVWVGAESGSQRVLDAMDKGTRVEQIHAATRRARHAGVRIGFFLQFGYPGERLEDIEKTLELVRACEPDEIGISVSYPLPGTRFFDLVEDRLGSKQNWIDSADLDVLYRGTFSAEFYRRLARVVQREFLQRRARGEVRRLRLAALQPRHVRRLGAWLYHCSVLPWERYRLGRVAIEREGCLALPSGMAAGGAAEPTPQLGAAE